MNCKKTNHTGCYKKLYVVVSIHYGYRHACMLFSTKNEAFETMKEQGFKYNRKEKYWYKNDGVYEYELDNYITVNQFNE